MYRTMVDSQQKSPVKHQRMQSSADLIIQEVMKVQERGKRVKRRETVLKKIIIYIFVLW